MFTLPDSDSYANADTDSCTEKATMDVNGIALRSVLNPSTVGLSPAPVETLPKIIIKPNSLYLGTGLEIGVRQCK